MKRSLHARFFLTAWNFKIPQGGNFFQTCVCVFWWILYSVFHVGLLIWESPYVIPQPEAQAEIRSLLKSRGSWIHLVKVLFLVCWVWGGTKEKSASRESSKTVVRARMPKGVCAWEITLGHMWGSELGRMWWYHENLIPFPSTEKKIEEDSVFKK